MRLARKIKESLVYLRESKRYIFAISAVFLSSIIIGFAFYQEFGFLDEMLKQLIDKIEGLGIFETIFFIFQNNLRSAFLGLFLGIFLGAFPVIAALSNGIVLGYVFRKVLINSGFFEFWRILPHGIFEIPAVMIALGLGIKLGMFIFSGNIKKEFWIRTKNSVILFIFVIFPLLLLAALIEGLLIAAYK